MQYVNIVGNKLGIGGGKRPSGATEKIDDNELEKEDMRCRDTGLVADVVLIFPIEDSESLARAKANAKPESGYAFIRLIDDIRGQENTKTIEKKQQSLEERQKARADAILRLRAAGLTVRRSQDQLGNDMYVKISAPLERLEKEARRQGLEMLVKKEVVDRERAEERGRSNVLQATLNKGGCVMAFTKLMEVVFGADSKRVYRDYDAEQKDDFDRGEWARTVGLKDEKEGRLFSPLERSRLIYAIIEGPLEHKDEGGRVHRGAELDLDLMVSDGVLNTYLSLHSSARGHLANEWGAMARIGPIQSAKTRLMANDSLCMFLWLLLCIFYTWYTVELDNAKLDFPVGAIFLFCLCTAALFGMLVQPLDQVRDYFGEKIAFYFAWMEHYSRYVFFLSIAAFAVVLIDATAPTDGTSELPHYAALLYCLAVAVWTTLFQEAWKRRNSVLAHTWDVEDFEEEEDPRPEFLASFSRGRWKRREETAQDGILGATVSLGRHLIDCLLLKGQMEEKPGFFTADGRFIEHPGGKKHRVFPSRHRLNTFLRSIPSMLLIGTIMFIGAISIMVFKMLMGVADEFRDDPLLDNSIGALLPMMLSTIWITIMNGVYRSVAEEFNKLENYRTETENNDALILKTVAFQFVNSYITLFYIAFFKSFNFPMGALFGQDDPTIGEPYRDMCGARATFSTIKADFIKYNFSASNVDPMCNPLNGTTLSNSNCRPIFVEHDCFYNELRLLMISYTLLRPCYELPLQILGSLIAKIMGQARYLKKVAEQGAKMASSGLKSANVSAKEVQLVSVSAANPVTKPDDERRADLHNQIAIEKAQSEYPGTFAEYNPKVIQFGYVAMFSSAFPLSALCAAVCNFVELRIDSYKLVSLSRRPRWAGAEDIGSWQGVINTLSWIALPVNVLILVFTSWDFRRLFVIPLVIGTRQSCYDPAYVEAFSATPFTQAFPNASVSADFFISPHAAYRGSKVSWEASCVDNVQDCFAVLGGEQWLPGTSFLSVNSTYSLSFTDFGLCRETSPLYNQWHCDKCTAWRNEVFKVQLLIALVLEHLLLLLKLLLAFLIPDKPQWVIDANARKQFANDLKEIAGRTRAASNTSQGGATADEEEILKLAGEINNSEDSPGRSAAMSHQMSGHV